MPNAGDMPGAPCHPRLGFLSSTGTSSGSNFHWHAIGRGWDRWLSNPTKETWGGLGGGARLARGGRRAARNQANKAHLCRRRAPETGPGSPGSAGEGIRNPNTAEDPAGPCSEQVYIATLAPGLPSVGRGQRPTTSYHHSGRELQPGARGQGGQSFPPLLKDGDATPPHHQDLGETTRTRGRRLPSTSGAPGGRLPKMQKLRSCMDITQHPSSSSTPGMPGVNGSERGVGGQHPCPAQHPLPEPCRDKHSGCSA